MLAMYASIDRDVHDGYRVRILCSTGAAAASTCIARSLLPALLEATARRASALAGTLALAACELLALLFSAGRQNREERVHSLLRGSAWQEYEAQWRGDTTSARLGYAGRWHGRHGDTLRTLRLLQLLDTTQNTVRVEPLLIDQERAQPGVHSREHATSLREVACIAATRPAGARVPPPLTSLHPCSPT